MRAFDWDLIRGGHYGQRSCEPHLQAEHMSAPTNAAKREESPCQPGAVHTWHETDMPTLFRNVRSQVQSRKHVLALSFSGFDPKPDLRNTGAASAILKSWLSRRAQGCGSSA